jgi:PAS domain S-box-containing protein
LLPSAHGPGKADRNLIVRLPVAAGIQRRRDRSHEGDGRSHCDGHAPNQSRASIARNEERLRLAAQTARFGIHDYDPATDRTLWSPELYAIAGLPPGTEITKAIVRSTVYPEDRQKVASAIQEALNPAGRGVFDEEFRIVRHDTGETRWVQNRCQTFFRDSANGRFFVRNVGVAIDISGGKRREEQLQLLLREVNHRAKNLLAVVQSIAFQTGKEGAADDSQPFKDDSPALPRATTSLSPASGKESQ